MSLNPTIRLQKQVAGPMTIVGDRHKVIEGAFNLFPRRRVPIEVDIFVFDTPSVDTDCTADEYVEWLTVQFQAIERWRAHDSVLIVLPTDRKGHSWSKSALTASTASAFYWQLFRHFIWLKQEADFDRSQYAFQDVWTFRKGNRPANGGVEIRYKDILRFIAHRDSDSHVGSFPPSVLVSFIELFARPGDTVMDPFAGRGPVMEAAELLSLSSISVELDPERAEYLRQRSNELETTR